jgi:hypothetical protein
MKQGAVRVKTKSALRVDLPRNNVDCRRGIQCRVAVYTTTWTRGKHQVRCNDSINPPSKSKHFTLSTRTLVKPSLLKRLCINSHSENIFGAVVDASIGCVVNVPAERRVAGLMVAYPHPVQPVVRGPTLHRCQ